MQRIYYSNQVLPYLRDFYGGKNLAMLDRYSSLLTQFSRTYRQNWAHVCSSSGRVELIGNHTDHNGGLVIGGAVNLDIIAAFRPNDSGTVNIVSRGRRPIRFATSDLSRSDNPSALIKGVLAYLRQNGYRVGGFDAYTDSIIPGSAGISSSAAVECLVGAIISECYNGGGIPAEVIARAGMYAENVYADKPCGLLDQLVAMEGGAVMLDFSDGVRCTHLNVSGNIALFLVYSGAKHSHMSHLYAAIPADMGAAAQFFGKRRLADVDEGQFFARFDELSRAVGLSAAQRARHFFEENRRVLLAADALRNGDTAALCALVNSSGDSSLHLLRNCSVDEGDTAIADIMSAARSICPCGVRVHGGGFAGTVLCVVPREYAELFASRATSLFGASNVYPLNLRGAGVTVM